MTAKGAPSDRPASNPSDVPLCHNRTERHQRAGPHVADGPDCIVKVRNVGYGITLEDGSKATYWVHVWDKPEEWA